ncbi:hypothetical protein SAY87_019561 [Trapa incisa]|uniref:Protein TILLER ANGLE CONTROL 1 n=1 Tax=Trapa incisa TaxID=236973 RepID=A0AAN7K7X2_9MYRT|nr:hypothetical protein SAY87_019561 [Trapa incisa]
MKIFSWVQRRLNPNQQLLKDDDFGRGVKKGDQWASGQGDKTLLEQVDGRLISWKDRILVIGTFGYDPLISQEQEQEQEREEVINHHGVVVSSSAKITQDAIEEGDGHGCDSDDNDNGLTAHMECMNDDEELNPLIQEIRGNYIEKHRDNQMVAKATVFSPQMNSNYSYKRQSTLNQKRETQGERTTLADLFLADSKNTEVDESPKAVKSSGKNKKTTKELEEEDTSTNKLHTPHLFSKKFIPHKSHGSRPMTKLHKLMRKMLKTKIHPELGVRDSDRDNYAKLEQQAEDEAITDHHIDRINLLLNFQTQQS